MTSNISSSTTCASVEIPQLVITKIMYNPDSSSVFQKSKDQEFIEIQNTGNTTADLTGVYFSGTGFVYQFPAHSEIRPGAIKILASNPIVFIAKYGIAPSGQFTRNLANEGENLVLADAFGNVIDSVSYSNLPPWPNADGNGYYLELIDPITDNSIASNWTASTNTIVSVKETETRNGLKIYPTPVKDNLNIESSGQIEVLELFDFQGRLIQKINVNSEQYTLNMSYCSQGIYLIQVITPGRNYIQKIIKE
jgi:hypothetical protein